MRSTTNPPPKTSKAHQVINLQSLPPTEKKKKISHAFHPESNLTQLIIIRLSMEEDAQHLATLLATHTTLKALEITDSCLDDGLFAILATSILQNQNLEFVTFENVDMVYRDYSAGGNFIPRLTQASFDLIMRLATQENLKSVHFQKHTIGNINLSPLIQRCYTEKKKPIIKIDDSKEFTDAMQLLEVSLSTEPQPKFTIQRSWCTPTLFPRLIEICQPHLKMERLKCHGEYHDYYHPPIYPLINDQQFLELLNPLKQQEDLYSLDLSYNHLTNACIKPLIAFLKGKRVIYLNLSFNLFSDDGIVELAAHLEQDATLIWLNLAGNPVKNLGVVALARALGNNSALLALGLDSCPIEPTSITNFLKEIQKNNALIQLMLPLPPATVRTGRYGNPVTQQAKPPAGLTKFLEKNRKHKDDIMLAVINGKKPDLITLLGYHVSPYVSDERGYALLHLAVEHTRVDIVDYLLGVKKVNRKIKNIGGQTAYDLAKASGNQRLLTCFKNPISPTRKQATLGALLSRRPPPPPLPVPIAVEAEEARGKKRPREEEETAEKKRPRIEDQNKINALYFAALNGQIDRVIALLNEGIAINSIHIASGETALHAAAKTGHLDMVRCLLSRGANLNTCNFVGQTPLHMACDYANPHHTVAVVQELLGAENIHVNTLDQYGRSALYAICGSFFAGTTPPHHPDKVEIAWLLVRNHADPCLSVFDLETGIEGMTALHKAVRNREYKMVKALLSCASCPINAQNGLGRTALHEAVLVADLDIIDRLLIDPRLNLTVRDGEHLTALERVAAIIQQHPDDENLQVIKQKIEARMQKNYLQFVPRTYFASSLNFFYGRRPGKPPLLIEGDKEHANLKAGMPAASEPGNQLTASLTFILQRSDGSRLPITINLQGKTFHPTMAWQTRVAVGQGRDRRYRHPEGRDSILRRFESAPEEAKQQAVEDEKLRDKPLSSEAIQALFAKTGGELSYEQLFTHSEQGLMDFLENMETIKLVADQLTAAPDFQFGCKILPDIILRMHSKFYLCANCEVGMLGEQNIHHSKFLTSLHQELSSRNCRLSRHHFFHLSVAISATTPAAGQGFKNVGDHQEVETDLRNHYETAIIQRTFEPKSMLMSFESRRK